MPPAKNRNHDDANGKEKSGGHTSTKMRRGASQQSHMTAAPTSAPVQVKEPEQPPPTIHWTSLDRSVLHTYRQHYNLPTPSSFASSYHQMVLSQPAGIGLYSPTMVRKRQAKRQVKDNLAMSVRKHFNGVGIQENDVIVDFLHKLQSERDSQANPSTRT